MMDSIAHGYRAVVLGASGGIGAALTRALAEDPRCGGVVALSRSGRAPEGPKIAPGRADLADEASLAEAAEALADGPPPALAICAAGYLHGPAGGPEKSWRQIEPEAMAEAFRVNAIGPALLAKHLLPRMPRGERAIFAALSARVGSIADNRAGGWYGYRASKAALNQILKCLAIEAGRKMRGLVVAGLQPGTVRTPLSAPFRGQVPEERLFEPDEAAAALLGVLDGLGPEASGRVFDWRGDEVPP